MTPKDLDLNLLIVLDVLLKEQHVTRAAGRLNLTQSAVSSALKRLRLAFNDDLLVLVGRKMRLTPRAEALMPKITALIAQIEQTIAEDKFDPLQSDHRFVIASADYTTFTLLPPLLKLMEQQAPRMRVQVFDISDHTIADMLLGKIDAIIAPRSRLFGEGLRSRTLFKEKLVCIASKKHPAVKGTIDLATFQRFPHVRYQPGREVSISAEAMQLKKQRVNSSAFLTCPSFAALPFLVGATSALALVQERLARQFEQAAKLQILPPPVRTDPLHISLFWAPSRNSDPAHVWLRDAIARAGQGV